MSARLCPECNGRYVVLVGRYDHTPDCSQYRPPSKALPLAWQRNRDDRMDAELRDGGGFAPTPGVCSIHGEAEPCGVCMDIADQRWASR